jgi:hypothetical protein
MDFKDINAARMHRKFHAVIRMINEYGKLRQSGLDRDDWGTELTEANHALWRAYRALHAKVGPYTCPVCGKVREAGWPCADYCQDGTVAYDHN